MLPMLLPVSPLVLALLAGPIAASPEKPPSLGDDVHEHTPPNLEEWSDVPEDPLPAIDCNEHKDTGYVQGDPFEITVVTVDGKPVEVQTANAFYQMAQAAAGDGVTIKVNSGFRTMEEQQYLYNCYINCNCNNCNLAAKPGYSNHQSGHALDLNTGGAGVYNWLVNHGGAWGFEATVPSEDWHWEWWGGGPPTNGPCGTPDFAAEYAAQSFPFASAPPIVLTVGDVMDAWIDLENTGKKTWTANTRLSPTPRDVASPLAAPSWLSPTRIAAPAMDTAPGNIGRFAFEFAATVPGDYYQTFGIVEEGVTWFSDKPLGGGPPDDQLEVHIVVVAGPPPPPPPPAAETTGDGESGSGPTSDTAASAGEEGGGEAEATGVAPTTGEPQGGTTGVATDAPADPDTTAGAGEMVEDGCGCTTDPAPASTALLAFFLLALPRKRRVIAP